MQRAPAHRTRRPGRGPDPERRSPGHARGNARSSGPRSGPNPDPTVQRHRPYRHPCAKHRRFSRLLQQAGLPAGLRQYRQGRQRLAVLRQDQRQAVHRALPGRPAQPGQAAGRGAEHFQLPPSLPRGRRHQRHPRLLRRRGPCATRRGDGRRGQPALHPQRPAATRLRAEHRVHPVHAHLAAHVGHRPAPQPRPCRRPHDRRHAGHAGPRRRARILPDQARIHRVEEQSDAAQSSRHIRPDGGDRSRRSAGHEVQHRSHHPQPRQGRGAAYSAAGRIQASNFHHNRRQRQTRSEEMLTVTDPDGNILRIVAAH